MSPCGDRIEYPVSTGSTTDRTFAGTDTLRLRDDELSYALGRQGAATPTQLPPLPARPHLPLCLFVCFAGMTRRKLAKSSGCIVEYSPSTPCGLATTP